MPFIAKHKNTYYVKDIIKQEIAQFIDIHVKCFSNYKSKKVGFVGSIAYYFQDIIKLELEKQGFEMAKVIKKPC